MAQEAPGVTWEQVAAAIEAEYAALYDLVPAELDDATLELAHSLAPEHLVARYDGDALSAASSSSASDSSK